MLKIWDGAIRLGGGIVQADQALEVTEVAAADTAGRGIEEFEVE